MRGEYREDLAAGLREAELPPRARRILGNRVPGGHDPGTTSACAENTRLHKDTIRDLRNYLRVRGEYHPGKMRLSSRVELPPRARRIHITVDGVDHSEGTTSACAENTGIAYRTLAGLRNYLRVRGEYEHITLPE